ncbi:MAG: HepT-like ribonuclease domain-containing protein [Candidatus Parvarchaeota archaeon]
MMDKDRILRRLTDLERYSSVLKGIAPNSYENYKASDIKTKAAVERYLQLISDIELEVMVLLYKAMDLGIAGDEEPLLNKFSGMLSRDAVEGFRKRRALRNILVHAYSDMHYDKETFEMANQLGDVASFIRGTKTLLRKRAS